MSRMNRKGMLAFLIVVFLAMTLLFGSALADGKIHVTRNGADDDITTADLTGIEVSLYRVGDPDGSQKTAFRLTVGDAALNEAFNKTEGKNWQEAVVKAISDAVTKESTSVFQKNAFGAGGTTFTVPAGVYLGRAMNRPPYTSVLPPYVMMQDFLVAVSTKDVEVDVNPKISKVTPTPTPTPTPPGDDETPPREIVTPTPEVTPNVTPTPNVNTTPPVEITSPPPPYVYATPTPSAPPPPTNRVPPPPPFNTYTEEELEDFLMIFDYDTPLFGMLRTGDDIPVYPFVFGGIGLIAVAIVLIFGSKRSKANRS